MADSRASTGAIAAALRGMRLLLCAALPLLLLACAQTRHHRGDGLGADARLGRGATVLLIEPDIELSELLASGVQEARADWTAAASAQLLAALGSELRGRGAELAVYAAAADAQERERQRQLILLHQAVGTAILLHRHFGMPLLHKEGRFDWTLGPGVRQLDPSARYGLFLFVRDSYASGGRKAVMALGLLLGVGVSLGQQVGFASLVDLDDGRVVWFNLLSAQSGDLREPEGASLAARRLLDGVPL